MYSKKNLLIIGGTGLLGSRITELLGEKINLKNLSRVDGVDITNPESLQAIENNSHEFVLLLAAKADVDGCEKDKSLGKEGDAWKINVEGVRNVAKVCLKSNKKLIYVSTDFVFNGEDTPVDGYTEDSTPDPINWYATTKFEGEKALRETGTKYIIARTAYPYRKELKTKTDFVRAIGGKLKEGKEVLAVSDHFMSPTFIDDFAQAIGKVIEEDASGIFHITGGQSLSPFEAAILIAKEIKADLHLVKKTTRAEFFKDRAQRPFNLSMKNAKISELGVVMCPFSQGIEKIF